MLCGLAAASGVCAPALASTTDVDDVDGAMDTSSSHVALFPPPKLDAFPNRFSTDRRRRASRSRSRRPMASNASTRFVASFAAFLDASSCLSSSARATL